MPADPTFSADFCSNRLKAIADPTRWAVAVQLIGGAKTVGALNDVLKIDPTLLSHHLKILRTEGFVVADRRGRHLIYSLAPEVALSPPGTGIDLGCCRLELHGDGFAFGEKERRS